MSRQGRPAAKRQLLTRAKQQGVDAARKAHRHIERGDFDQAFRAAGDCYRLEPTAARRCLYERAHLLLAADYERKGKRADCVRVLERLLNLGITAKDVQRGVAPLLVQCGMSERILGDAKNEEAAGPLVEALADRAILKPEVIPATLPQLHAGVQQVRQALAAIAAGDEETALAQFADTSRTSPFADWKLFVRGLAAYHRGAWEEMKTNWQRLAPDRLAARMARPLGAIADSIQTNTPIDPKHNAALQRLEQATLGTDILRQLDNLSNALQRRDLRQAAIEIGNLREPLRKLDPAFPARLSQILYPGFVREGISSYWEGGGRLSALEYMTGILDPIPLDPRWDRFWGLIDDDAADYVADDVWKRYADTVGQLAALSPEERRVAPAIVWLHLGSQYLGHAYRDARRSDVSERDAVRRRNRSLRLAADCFATSRKLAPDYLPAHLALARVYEADKREHKRVLGLYQEIAERFPDDVEALERLAELFLSKGDAFAAEECLTRLRELRPLDEELRASVAGVKYLVARQCARQGQIEAARRALADALSIAPQRADYYVHWTYVAAVELKAENGAAASAALERARAAAPVPGSVDLFLTIEGTLHKLPKPAISRFEAEFQKQLAAPVQSAFLEAVVRIFGMYLNSRTSYNGFTRHKNWILAYLERGLAAELSENAIRAAIALLRSLPEKTILRNQYAALGCRLHPNVPAFLYWRAQAEIDSGPDKADIRETLDCLRRARRILEKAKNHQDWPLLEDICSRIEMFERLEGMSGFFRTITEAAERVGASPAELHEVVLSVLDQAGLSWDDIESDLDDDE